MGLPAIFNNSAFGNLRAVMRDGEPWFVAKDVCDCLDLENVSQALVRVPDRHKSLYEVEGQGFQEAATMNLVSEPGLYRLIFASRKPSAEAFQDWVTEEVLRAIRKTGKFEIQRKPIPAARLDYDQVCAQVFAAAPEFRAMSQFRDARALIVDVARAAGFEPGEAVLDRLIDQEEETESIIFSKRTLDECRESYRHFKRYRVWVGEAMALRDDITAESGPQEGDWSDTLEYAKTAQASMRREAKVSAKGDSK